MREPGPSSAVASTSASPEASSCARHATAALASKFGATLEGPGDLEIRGVQALDDAGPHDITFISDRAHAERWAASRAAAAVVTRGLTIPGHDASSRALLVVENAELAMAGLLELFAPPAPLPADGVDARAIVDPSATLGRDVRIGPCTTIGPNCEIGDRTVIHPGAHIYADCRIGAECVIHAGVVIRERCTIGARVIIHPNVSIGADGFGYRPAAAGRGLVKVPQIGTVVLGDDVEIGANSCIDRGKFGATVVGAGTKIDNLVQIAHNCRIGHSCVIAGQAGLAGSVTVGDGVQIAGAARIADHLTVGSGARIGANSGVISHIPPGETWLGYPAAARGTVLRQWSALRKLPDFIRLRTGLRERGPADGRR